LKSIIIAINCFALVFSSSAFAEDAKFFSYKPFEKPYELRDSKSRSPNYVFPALGSFLIPGLDQMIERQSPYWMIYSGTALTGAGLVFAGVNRMYAKGEYGEFELGPLTADIGLRLYLFAGGMSALQSFRSAALARKHQSQFDFMKVEDEHPIDVALAPWTFKHITSTKTWIPLAAGLTVFTGVMALAGGNTSFSVGKGVSALVTSHNAGVWEEAVFRGWLMPMTREWISNDFWSNAIVATVFAAAHISDQNSIPWFQLLSGWYFGWIVQENDYKIGEAAFLHAWWDVMALTFSYLYTQNTIHKNDAFEISLPPIKVTF